MTDAAASYMSRCANLQTIDFNSCEYMTDAAAKHLSGCSQLKRVMFAYCTNLTDSAVDHLSSCTQLQFVDFIGCDKVTKTAAQYHPQCCSLRQRCWNMETFGDGESKMGPLDAVLYTYLDRIRCSLCPECVHFFAEAEEIW